MSEKFRPLKSNLDNRIGHGNGHNHPKSPKGARDWQVYADRNAETARLLREKSKERQNPKTPEPKVLDDIDVSGAQSPFGVGSSESQRSQAELDALNGSEIPLEGIAQEADQEGGNIDASSDTKVADAEREIYESDANAVREVEKEITVATNNDSAVLKANKTGEDYSGVRARVNMRESMKRWYGFVASDPERAERVAKSHSRTHPGIPEALQKYRKEYTHPASQEEFVSPDEILAKMIVTEEEKQDMVNSANSYEELYEALQAIGEIPVPGAEDLSEQDPNKVFTSDELIQIIKEVREGTESIVHVPFEYGLRKKVNVLLDREYQAQMENASSVPTEGSGDKTDGVSPEALLSDPDFLRSYGNESGAFKMTPETVEYIESLTDEEIASLDEFPLRLITALGQIGYTVRQGETIKSVISMTSSVDPTEKFKKLTPSEAVFLLKKYISEHVPKKKVAFDERFRTEFGLTKEELMSIEGFDKLSQGQQKLVFENFTQLTLGNVREEAARLCTESSGAKREKMISLLGGVLGNALSGVRESFTKGYTALNTEKEIATKMRTGGFEVHGDLLRQLVASVALYGPRVHENANGELLVDLVNIRERARSKENRDAEWFATLNLNAYAHEFAKTPASWQGNTLGVDTGEEWKITSFIKEKIFKVNEKVHARAYAEREQKYIEAKEALEKVLRAKGKNDLEISEILLGIDSRVHQLQTIQTDPDAIEELAKIEDKNFWIESAKSLVKGPGFYMGLGFAGRSVLGAGLGVLAAPVTAGGVAYIRSWNKTAAELRERDRNARAGVKDEKEGALNIVSAADLTKKTQRLLRRCEKATGDQKVALLAQLRARVEYINDKQMLGRVSYGEVSTKITQQLELTKELSEALAYLVSADGALSTEANKRLEKSNRRLDAQLANTEESIIASRRLDRALDQQKSVRNAALFSIAGVAMGEYLHHLRTGSEVPTAGTVGNGARMAESPSSNDSQPLTVETPVSNQSMSSKGYQAEVRASDNRILEEVAQKEIAQMNPYDVKSGDTLYAIMKERVPFVKNLEPNRQDFIMKNILDSFSEEELKKIGVKTGDANRIFPGEKINIKMLNEILEDRRLNLESGKISAIPSTAASHLVETSSLGDEMVASETRTQDQGYIASAQEYRTDGMDPLNDSPDPEVQRVYATPEFSGPKVAEFKEKFFAGKISERDWEYIRNKSIESVRYNESDAIAKRINMLRTVVESGAGVTPRGDETVESFFARGARVIADREDTLQENLAYDRAVVAYNESDTTPRNLDDRVARDKTAERDLRNQVAQEEAKKRAIEQQRIARNSSLNEKPHYEAGDTKKRWAEARSGRRS